MKIRPASDEDAPAIAAIWNNVIRTTATTFTSIEKSRVDVEEMIATRPVLVAQIDGSVIGFASFGPFRAGPGYARVAEHSIYVQSGLQRKGAGLALMDALQARAKKQGLTHLIAGIGGEAEQSIAFHVRLGFEKVAHLPEVGWKFGRTHDLIFMQKRI